MPYCGKMHPGPMRRTEHWHASLSSLSAGKTQGVNEAPPAARDSDQHPLDLMQESLPHV